MYKEAAHKTIFHEILGSDLPESEKSPSRLWQDGQVTVIAGTLTTASALSYATYCFLTQPDVLKRLREELQTAIPNPSRLPPLATLEQLPYLRSCIKEALRLSNGVSSRLQRIDPEKPILFTDKVMNKGKPYLLPPGTPISMTGMLMHTDPEVFEEPDVFNPQRWLDHPGLEKYLVPFARGSRQCIGMDLAYAELYVALALIFRLYGSKEVKMDGDQGYLELYDTEFERDIEIVGDGITPLNRKESKGLRVRIRE
jgi:cytochrome P450